MKYFYIVLNFYLLLSNPVFSHSIIINPSNGSDYTGNGTVSNPYKTLLKAGQVANGGDSILIRGGHYTLFKYEFIRWNYSDSSKIFIMPYQNEIVILDGAGYSFQYSWEAVLNISSSRHIEIKNLEIKNNSKGSGIRVVSDLSESKFVTIKNCKVSSTNQQGILIQASNILVDSCEITNACLVNKNQAMGFSGWPATLCTFVDLTHPTMDICRNIIFSNNKISRSWGEGIAFIRTKYFEAKNNIVRDCFSGYIYSDNSREGVIKNNWLYSASDSFNITYDNGHVSPAVGIFWAAEGNNYCLDSIVENIKIFNNLIVRTGPAFGWFDDASNHFLKDSYKNIEIYYNTVYNTIGYQSFYLDDTNINPNRVLPTGCKFKNNIICKARYPVQNQIFREYFTGSNDYDTSWEIRNNCFINGYPSGFSTNNIQGYPEFLDTVNIFSALSFKIKSNSNCINNAAINTGVTNDYWNKDRSLSAPTIGFYEWTGLDKNLNITAFIQGFYNSYFNNMISDSVRVFLRNAFSPYSIIDSSKEIIFNNGTGIFSFNNIANGTNNYLVIKHRNSIETWSNTSLQFVNGILNYNFSTSANFSYGGNLKQIDLSPLRYGIYSGDVNQDGFIELSDGALIDNDAVNFVNGYIRTDLNGDNFTDLSDGEICDNNSFNYVSVIRP